MQILKKCIYPLKMYPHRHMDNESMRRRFICLKEKAVGGYYPYPPHLVIIPNELLKTQMSLNIYFHPLSLFSFKYSKQRLNARGMKIRDFKSNYEILPFKKKKKKVMNNY